MDGDGFGANGIVIREHPSGGWEMYAFLNLATDTIMGMGTGLPAAFALDSSAVLASHPTDHATIGSGAKARM